MGDNDEDERKKPRPVRTEKKRSHPPEIAEATPWRLTRNDSDLDRHRHVA